MNANRLRQIAILVDSLDTAAADQLLDQLPDDLQQRVRDAVVDLTNVSDSERQSVLNEFRRGRTGGSSSAHPISGGGTYAQNAAQNEVPSMSSPTYSPIRRHPPPNQPASSTSLPPAAPLHEITRDEMGIDWNASATRPQPTTSFDSFSHSTGNHWETMPAPASTTPTTLPTPGPSADLNDTLANVDLETLASVVLRESPQILAAVLSLLPPLKSAQLLELCPPPLQVAALERLRHLTELDDEIVSFLQQELSLVIRQRMRLKQRQRVGTSALADILVAAQRLHSPNVTKLVQEQLQGSATHNRPRAAATTPITTPSLYRPAQPAATERFPIPAQATPSTEQRLVSPELDHADALADVEVRLSFAELMDCDSGSLQSLLATAKPQLTLLALRGASQKFLDRVLKMLPRQEAKEVQFRMQNVGPTRVQDIQQAQQYLLRLATLLEDLGRFRRPRSRSAA